MPFLVLKVISWRTGRDYSTILQYKKHFIRILCSRCVIYMPSNKLEKADKSSHIRCHFTRLKHRRNRKLSKKWFSKPTKNVYKTSEKIKSETVAPKSCQTYPLLHLSTSRNLIILECQMFGEGQKSVWINIPYIRGEELETFLNQTVTYFYHAEEILSANMSMKN